MVHQDKLTRTLSVIKSHQDEAETGWLTRQNIADEAEVSLGTVDDARRIMSIPGLAGLVLDRGVNAGTVLRLVRDPRGARKFNKSRLILELLIERQNGQCAVCERTLSLRYAVLDHIKPVSMGGTTVGDNVQAVHVHCNREKGDRMPTFPFFHESPN